jgi:hypothetical protein
MTSDREWNPYSEHFNQAERAMINHHRYPDPRHIHFNSNGESIDGRSFGAVYIHRDTTTTTMQDSKSVAIDPSLCTFDYTYDLTQRREVSATSSKEHRSIVPPATLARRWGTSVGTVTG